jgi:TolB-like protein/class 3 adenylate cyclase
LAREQRKLAAIVAADVVGYSRLMGRDESGTLARLRKNRSEHLEPVLAKYGGRLVKLTGDGALVEFGSAVDALSAAIEFQQAMAETNQDQPADTALVFRMGLHLGDLIVEGDDLYGDGVNVAARLEGEAPPGGIVVSGALHEAAAGRLPAEFVDLGRLSLKNIDREVQAYRVEWHQGHQQPSTAATSGHSAGPAAPLPLPDKPSIAVLPFQNMSGDPEQEYFVDGLVEDIITGLSRFKALFVIARNSSFAYKGKSSDVRQVGRDLGVRYVLEGSVRKAASRVRITGQLVDTTTGAHLWANRIDGGLADIFDLQDQVTESIVGAIAPAIETAEFERAKRKPTASLNAYDHYLRGLVSFHQSASRQANEEALRQFNMAIEIDADFASAFGRAAICYTRAKSSRWISNTAHEVVEVTRLAQGAVKLGKDDAIALATGGYALAYFLGELGVGAASIDRALFLNPNLAEAWYYSGWAKIWLGEPELAIERFARAIRLNPLDPLVSAMRAGTAHAYFFLGRYDEAASWGSMASRDNPELQPGLRIEAASHAMAGRLEQAHEALVRLRHGDPTFRVSSLQNALGPYGRAEDVSRYQEGLRRAGLPE